MCASVSQFVHSYVSPLAGTINPKQNLNLYRMKYWGLLAILYLPHCKFIVAFAILITSRIISNLRNVLQVASTSRSLLLRNQPEQGNTFRMVLYIFFRQYIRSCLCQSDILITSKITKNLRNVEKTQAQGIQ